MNKRVIKVDDIFFRIINRYLISNLINNCQNSQDLFHINFIDGKTVLNFVLLEKLVVTN